MASKASGWHFSTKNASAEQINEFSIDRMASMLTEHTPYLWDILGTLLVSDSQVEQKIVQHTLKTQPSVMSVMEWH